MIEELYLQNFQSHKETHLEFSKGVNVIIGTSDSGKTSILRALRWVFQNKPTGTDFRSHWGGDTSVTVILDNAEIERRRTDSLNLYRLGDQDFVAFKQDIPQEILDVINMNSDNIQRQLDSPYLLTETSGAVASHFNRIAKLDLIDQSLADINKGANSVNAQIKSNGLLIKEKEEELANLIDINAAESALEIIENLYNKKEKISGDIDDLSDFIDDIFILEDQLDNYVDLTDSISKIDLILADYDSLATITKDYLTIRELALQIYYADVKIKDIDKLLIAEDAIDACLLLYTRRDDTSTEIEELSNLYKDINTNLKRQDRQGNTILQLEKEFTEAMPDICPLCDTVL